MSRDPEQDRGRFRRWLDDWDVFIMIMLTGLLTVLVVFMGSDAHPEACHQALSHHVAADRFTWVCSHP